MNNKANLDGVSPAMIAASSLKTDSNNIIEKTLISHFVEDNPNQDIIFC